MEHADGVGDLLSGPALQVLGGRIFHHPNNGSERPEADNVGSFSYGKCHWVALISLSFAWRARFDLHYRESVAFVGSFSAATSSSPSK